MNRITATMIAIAWILPTAAVAQDFDIYMGGGGPRYYDDEPRDHRDYRGYREYQPYRQRLCTPQQALAIARSEGLPGAQIGRTTNKWIEIRGSHHRSIVFGLGPRCPILGYND